MRDPIKSDLDACKQLWRISSMLPILMDELSQVESYMKDSKNLRRFTIECGLRDERRHLTVSRENIEKQLEYFGETGRQAAQMMMAELMVMQS